MLAARVARFYGHGVGWAMDLPLGRLVRWAELMAQVARRENVR